MAFATDHPGLTLLEPGLRVAVEVPATSANLGPGFDCFGLALDWRERVVLEVTAGGYDVGVTGEGADQVPRDATHLILRSAVRGLADLGRQAPGLRLRCHNTIPHGRGLGSSSAAIVAGLLAAASLVHRSGEETPHLRRWLLQHADAVEGHPDNVAAAIHGGFVVAYRTPEGPEVASVPTHPDVAVTALVPDQFVATKAARGLLPATVPHRSAAHNSSRSALLVHALSADPERLLEATRDWLHQDYREPAMPASWSLMTSLRGQGYAAVISGAGPTVLVLGRAEALKGLQVGVPGFRAIALAVGDAAAAVSVP